MLRKLLTLAAVSFALPAWAEVELPVTYLKLEVPRPPVLSNLDPIPEDLGEAGAQLGLADNQTTGKFLGHDYSLTVTRVPENGDWLAAAREALAETRFLILDAPAQAQLELADLPEAQGAVLFNATAPDAALRDESCRANLLHSLPSTTMRADALMQFLVKRRWTDLVMIARDHPGDKAFAKAMKRAITKFGLNLKAEKTWVFDADMRRNAAREVPLFTQRAVVAKAPLEGVLHQRTELDTLGIDQGETKCTAFQE
jgi:ABC transporter substrate binding protein (PQQ-dependent alcohol dehydrogenase system)